MMKPVALFLMMTMRMMMVSVSAGPLPPSLNDSRRDDQITVSPQLLVNKEENSTRFRFESRQSVNNSLEDFSRDSNRTTNETSPFIFILPLEKLETSEDVSPNVRCFLPTCGTASLASSLQKGDEKAGGATTDPFGIGKK
ncbi:uncharacterized protein zgc:193726 isoform X10 [Dicentrarchus labrax]|uniref:uncharacterized protein zgc:193726 isoform X10 n=1 Tax=Dicentrarchus labrax TaxID=13489 RepID=UPI0021F647F6|nr:uncharacterized protein zgc:193726 isoform X10 [Dicentrarchus labrax]